MNILVSDVGILCRIPSFDRGFLQTQQLLFQMDLNHTLDMIFIARKANDMRKKNLNWQCDRFQVARKDQLYIFIES